MQLSELRVFLEQDEDVRVLFVEGTSDLEFWRLVVPTVQRQRTVVYSASSIQIPGILGGEKGRLVTLAHETLTWPQANRIRFFIDADNDRVLGRVLPRSITLTDFRDFESYVFVDQVFDTFCKSCNTVTSPKVEETRGLAVALLRPIGILRVASDRCGMKLPFQKTFEAGSLSRFLKEDRRGAVTNMGGIIDALLRHAEYPSPSKADVAKQVRDEESRSRVLDDVQVIHGKDLIAFVSWKFKMKFDVATTVVDLCIKTHIPILRELPGISFTENWIRH